MSKRTTRDSRNSHHSRKDLVEMYLQNDILTGLEDYKHMTPEEMYKHLKASGQMYNPAYCVAVIKHMELGKTFQSFAALVHVSVQTLKRWAKAKPEFLEAKEIGHAKALNFWEEKLHKAITKEEEADAKLLIIKLKNEYKEFYVEDESDGARPTEIHIHTGIEGVPVDDAIEAEFTKALEESGYKKPEEDDSPYSTEGDGDASIDPESFTTYDEPTNKDDEDLL